MSAIKENTFYYEKKKQGSINKLFTKNKGQKNTSYN